MYLECALIQPKTNKLICLSINYEKVGEIGDVTRMYTRFWRVTDKYGLLRVNQA